MRSIVHLLLHALVPIGVARVVWPRKLWRACVALLLTNLIDLDHLLAYPIYDPNRCSLGFHPLHSVYAIVAYGLLVVSSRTRMIAVGLLIHIALDAIDCLVMAID